MVIHDSANLPVNWSILRDSDEICGLLLIFSILNAPNNPQCHFHATQPLSTVCSHSSIYVSAATDYLGHTMYTNMISPYGCYITPPCYFKLWFN